MIDRLQGFCPRMRGRHRGWAERFSIRVTDRKPGGNSYRQEMIPRLLIFTLLWPTVFISIDQDVHGIILTGAMACWASCGSAQMEMVAFGSGLSTDTFQGVFEEIGRTIIVLPNRQNYAETHIAPGCG